MTRADTLVIVDMVASRVGHALHDQGFVHRKSSRSLRRETGAARQELIFGFDLRPQYARTSLVFYPQLRVEYSALAPYTEHAGSPGSGVSVLQPLVFGASAGEPMDWRIELDGNVAGVAAEIASAAIDRAVPLLDALVDPDGLVRAYAKRDPRILWLRQTIAAVIVGESLRGNHDIARHIAQEQFRGVAALSVEFPRVAELLREQSKRPDTEA